jgi:hypothetical protein
MSLLESISTLCPYCGEFIDLLIDCSITEQQYIEDCSVCCRPITINIEVNVHGQALVVAKDENEV